MRESDLITGQIYKLEFYNDSTNVWIIKVSKVEGGSVFGAYFCTSGSDFYENEDELGDIKSCKILPITQEEINHLLACIEAGEYVDAPKNVELVYSVF